MKMVKCDPRSGKYVAICLLYRGDVVPRWEEHEDWIEIPCLLFVLHLRTLTVCPRSLVPFNIKSYYIIGPRLLGHIICLYKTLCLIILKLEMCRINCIELRYVKNLLTKTQYFVWNFMSIYYMEPGRIWITER